MIKAVRRLWSLHAGSGRTGSAATGFAGRRERHEADEVVYVATGQVTEQALRYAVEKRIRLLQADDLAVLLRGVL